MNILNVSFRNKKNFSSESDISLAISGDKYAYIRLIKEQRITMYRVAKSILFIDADIEDAVSETILKSYTNIHKLRKSEYFKTWLIKILINECFQLLKKQKKELNISYNNTKYPTIIDNSKHIDLYEAINTLDYDLRIITLLFYFEDMKYSDISKALRIKEGTVKSRLYRAKQKLKILLDGDE